MCLYNVMCMCVCLGQGLSLAWNITKLPSKLGSAGLPPISPLLELQSHTALPDFLCGLWRSKLRFSHLKEEHFTNHLSSLPLPSKLSSQTKEKEYNNDDVDDGINDL